MANDVTGTPDPATGTTAAAADGAAAAQAGGAAVVETPEQLRQRIADLESQRKQDLARLTSGEEAARRARELEAENEHLRRQASSPSPPTGYDPNAQVAQVWQQFAEQNPEAAQIIAAKEQLDQQRFGKIEAEARWYRELSEITDAKERAEVEARAKELRVSPAWARRDLRAQKADAAEKEAAELRQRIADEEARRQRGTVATHAAPAPPPPLSDNEIKVSDYARKLRELQADGKMEEALALKRRKDSGELKVLDG